jgi:outer membrane protein TolC
MSRLGAAACLALAGCLPASRPWELPWPREAVVRIESVKSLPDGRYPVDLPTVLRLAGVNSLDVAYVREKLYEAHARHVLAVERLIPAVGPELTFRRHEGLTQGTDGTIVDVDKQQTFVGGRLKMTWQVGEALYASLAASRRYDATEQSLRSVENAVALAAGLAYFDLLREQVRARVLSESVRISRRLEEQFGVAVEAGRGFRGDVLRARVQASGGRIGLERAEEARRAASVRLGSLLRLAPGIELVAAEEEPQPLELVSAASESEVIERAMDGRPELREAMIERLATEDERSAATWAPLVPDVQADLGVGGLGHTASELGNTQDYAVTLGWRIGPGGIFDVGRRRWVDARARQAEIQVERVRQRIVDEVRLAWGLVQSRSRLMKIAGSAVKDAEEALKLNQERQAAAIGIPLEVLQSEEALTRARVEYYTSVVEYAQAQLRLSAAIGRRP